MAEIEDCYDCEYLYAEKDGDDVLYEFDNDYGLYESEPNGLCPNAKRRTAPLLVVSGDE